MKKESIRNWPDCIVGAKYCPTVKGYWEIYCGREAGNYMYRWIDKTK